MVGRIGGERAAEQLGPFSHAGEPVAGPVAGKRVIVVGSEVLDGQEGAGRLVVEADFDPVRAGVLPNVGERLLGPR